MIVTTTTSLEGKPVKQYLGVVTGESIAGANIIRDIQARFRDVFGGRSGAYEQELRKARQTALQEMQDEAQKLGANAVLAIDIDYETVGGTMLMVTASGTAVQVEE